MDQSWCCEVTDLSSVTITKATRIWKLEKGPLFAMGVLTRGFISCFVTPSAVVVVLFSCCTVEFTNFGTTIWPENHFQKWCDTFLIWNSASYD